MTRTYVLHPFLKRTAQRRCPTSCLLESIDLAEAISLDVVRSEAISLSQITPATYLGSGTVERIQKTIAERNIQLVVVNTSLSPIQQRNLEKAFKAKVIDRTGLILEIFGERAQTREGCLQVEHAALSYQKSRLVRSWTHLERQRGGFGFLGGPGESQLELDKRMIQTRLKKIEQELAQVKRTRALHRKGRQRAAYPVVALVGYTNSGKSTLFNRLTSANVLVKDMLFATLDPTMRLVRMPSGRKIILSDTVGFISDLPHELVSAFQATLEEVVSANLLLQVHDITNPEHEEQAQDVADVLCQVFDADHIPVPMLQVWNKADLLSVADHKAWQTKAVRFKDKVLISAKEGTDIQRLFACIDQALGHAEETRVFKIKPGQEDTLQWLYAYAHVQSVEEKKQYLKVTVSMSEKAREQFGKL